MKTKDENPSVESNAVLVSKKGGKTLETTNVHSAEQTHDELDQPGDAGETKLRWRKTKCQKEKSRSS